MAKKALDEMYCKDQLTGVYNRHKLQEIVTNNGELDLHRSISFIILDIDYFKTVNDTHGHDAGDIVLQMLSSTIQKSVRQNDMIIRWGGEEFVIILFGCKECDAIAIAEALRLSVSSLDTGICPITISSGIAEYCGGHYRETVKKADEALYYSKRNGRNRVTAYSQI